MPNFKLLVEYNGTNYAGWQRQKNSKTIQGEIEKSIKKIFGQKITIVGSGRTDAGVHALGQTANFSIDTKFSKEKVKKALNFHLARNIRIKKIDYVASSFHSRFKAKRKIYRYIIVREYSPFLKDKVYFCPYRINLGNIKKAARFLLGRHNFVSFQNRGSGRKNAVVTLYKIEIKKIYLNPGQRTALAIDVEANAFLYRMVRNLVGLLLEVGKGNLKPEMSKAILKKKNRRKAPMALPAQGLYLLKVKY